MDFLYGFLLYFGYDLLKKGLVIEKFREFPITYTLIILNLFIFLLTTISPHLTEDIFQWGGLNGYYLVLQGDIYRLFSSMFLHNDIMHISMNMLSIYMVGRLVERLFSTLEYLTIYFISGLFGSFTYIYLNPLDWAVGASGALFGIFGALAGFAFVNRKRMGREFIGFMQNFGVVLLINFFIGIIFPNIAISAHIGGLVSGFIGGFIVAKGSNYIWIYTALSIAIFIVLYLYLPNIYVSL